MEGVGGRERERERERESVRRGVVGGAFEFVDVRARYHIIVGSWHRWQPTEAKNKRTDLKNGRIDRSCSLLSLSLSQSHHTFPLSHALSHSLFVSFKACHLNKCDTHWVCFDRPIKRASFVRTERRRAASFWPVPFPGIRDGKTKIRQNGWKCGFCNTISLRVILFGEQCDQKARLLVLYFKKSAMIIVPKP